MTAAESFDLTGLPNQSLELSFTSSSKQMCMWLQRGGLFICVLFNDMIGSLRQYSIGGGTIMYDEVAGCETFYYNP
jgi:hypothetical protein